MKISRMNLWSNGNNRAFFDLETDEGITFKGFKVMDGQNGLFVSFPSSKGKDGKWYDNVYMPREVKDKLSELAISEYNQLSGQSVENNSDKNNAAPF